MPERNLVQALLPAGAESLPNPAGTATGICARLGECRVFVVPGVPREMRAMFDLHIAPRLGAQAGRVILTAFLSYLYNQSSSFIPGILSMGTVLLVVNLLPLLK